MSLDLVIPNILSLGFTTWLPKKNQGIDLNNKSPYTTLDIMLGI